MPQKYQKKELLPFFRVLISPQCRSIIYLMNPLFNDYLDAPWLEHTVKTSFLVRTVMRPIAKRVAAKAPILTPGSELIPWEPKLPRDTVFETITVGGIPVYLYRTAAQKQTGGRIIYYVHGGGFVTGGGKYCRFLAATLHKYFGLPVISPDYRLAPEFKWPAGLDAVEAGYKYITGELGYMPEDIIVMGESAGGNLTLALNHRLKAGGLPLPGYNAIISAAVDLAFAGPSQIANLKTDPVFPGGVSNIRSLYVDEHDVTNPEVSPIYGDFTGFPPTYICADDGEIFVSDSLACADKMYKAGVKVKAHIFHGLWHAFALMPFSREAKTALNEIKDFTGLTTRSGTAQDFPDQNRQKSPA
jgi:acetyl esterase/lipase